MQNQQGGGGQQEQIMQIIQAYAQATQTDPRKIIEQLQQMKPEQQQQALAQMVEALQGGGQEEQQGGMDPRMQQQMMAQQGQPPMMYGGAYAYGGSYDDGSFSGNQYYNYGGAYVPTYGEYAYGGPMMEQPSYFNQQSPMMYGGDMGYGGAMNNGMMYRDNQYAKGGTYNKPSSKKANFAKNTSKSNYADGGIVVGQTMEATPELLQKLKEGGYTFEYVR